MNNNIKPMSYATQLSKVRWRPFVHNHIGEIGKDNNAQQARHLPRHAVVTLILMLLKMHPCCAFESNVLNTSPYVKIKRLCMLVLFANV